MNRIFEKCLVILSGSIEVRLSCLIDIMVLSELYEWDYNIMWKVDDACEVEISDVLVNPIFREKIKKNFNEVIESGNYLYNPNISLKQVLTYIDTLNPQTQQVQTIEWFVIENNEKVFDIKKVNKGDGGVVNYICYEKIRTDTFNTLMFDSYIMSYYHLFCNKFVKDDLNTRIIGIYVKNIESFSPMYYDVIKRFSDSKNNCILYIVFEDVLNNEDIEVVKKSIKKNMDNVNDIVMMKYSSLVDTNDEVIVHRENIQMRLVELLCLMKVDLIITDKNMKTSTFTDEISRLSGKPRIYVDTINNDIDICTNHTLHTCIKMLVDKL